MKTIQPKGVSEEKLRELKEYLSVQWQRARDGRTTQVDDQYRKWSQAYEGVPLEKERSVPFYKASNFVVKLIRIYVDTFVARTLNVIHATQPLFVVDGLPDQTWKDPFELYINRKTQYDWDYYQHTRDLCFRGAKNGTVVFKQPWTEKKTIDVKDDGTEQPYTYFRGPDTRPIPFEDFYVYPITVECLSDAKIKFHRVRYVKEDAERRVDNPWKLPDGKSISSYLQTAPDSAKIQQEKSAAGLSDNYTQELHVIECYLEWSFDGNKYYDIIVEMEEKSCDIFDYYYNPSPRNISIFNDYRPYPREGIYYGESLAQILGQSQEEASRIHNERRDNSTIASAVCWKRKSGSLVPNPSTNWYPGKVFDLQDIDDLEVLTVGRNYENMIEQEDYCFNLANQLSGIGDVMKAPEAGSMGKRGIYNTQGTLAVVAEGNQRQDTNIRDVRAALGRVIFTDLKLQAKYDPADPLIDLLPKDAQSAVRDCLKFLSTDKARYVHFQVKASNAGVNKEVQKANLMAISQVLGQYGQTVMGLSQQLMNQQTAPGLRMLLNDILNMHRGMASRLLKAFDEWDEISELPDAAKAIERAIPGGSRGSQDVSNGAGSQGMDLGPAPPAQSPVSRGLLASLANLPQSPGTSPGPAGMG